MSHDIAAGIETHRALKLVGRVGHHMMAAATTNQAIRKCRGFTAPPVWQS